MSPGRQKQLTFGIWAGSMKQKLLVIVLSLASLCTASAWAVEVLSAGSLAAYCESFSEHSDAGKPCERYVQGFIDGAVATDVRVMLNVEAEQQSSGRAEETFTERAMRTRIGMTDARRAAGYAEFCLGDPVPLREVVAHVVADLKIQVESLDDTTPARDLVYESLRRHYPCSP